MRPTSPFSLCRIVFSTVALIAAGSTTLPAEEAITLAGFVDHDQSLARAHDVELQGMLAFVPGKAGSLSIVDVEQPERPRIVWAKFDPELLEDAETVLPAGKVLYVGARDFLSYDISDPAGPKLLGKLTDRPRVDKINGMIRRGDVILTANKSGFVAAISVADPRSPRLLGALDTQAHGQLRSPHDIAAYGDHVVVVDQSRAARYKVRLYRVADAETHALLPVEKWSVAGAIDHADLDGANRVMVSGKTAYVACSQSGNFQLGTIDIADPQKPRHLATLPFAGVHATGLAISNSGRVLFAAGGQTVQALDVSDPAQPRALAVCRSQEAFPAKRDNAHDLVYRDGYLYVSAQNDHRLCIFKVNDAAIRELAQ